MTNKEIIINGVDVSKCDKLIVNQLYGYACNCEEDTHIISSCKNRHNCYYKQLARKTQECEELKSESFTRESLISMQEKDIDRYRKTLEEIEEFAYCIKNFNFGYDELGIGQDIIAYADDILDIINKAKDGNNE